VFKGLNVSNGL